MLNLTSIKKTFNKGTLNEKIAIENLDLSVKKGDFITIIGSNGAGKSTLFNVIAGDFFIDEGNISLDDKDVTFMPAHYRSKYLGRLFQDPMRGTAPNMTIEENLSLAYLRAKKHNKAFFSFITKKEKEFFKEHLLRLDMGMENMMKQPVGLLSGGQRQALTLLMATIEAPKILLLDEHTAALDPKTAEKVLNLTKEIVKESNITCLMITHNMQQALELGNRTLMMDSGNIILDISGKERENTSVEDLIEKFKLIGKNDDNIFLR